MARTPSERELAGILIGHGIVDFISGGRLTKVERNALWKVIKRLGPPAVRGAAMTIPRIASTAVAGARFVTMRHPYIAAAVVTYEVVKNREQIAQLAREGWEVVEPVARGAYEIAEAAGVYDRPPGIQAPSFLDPVREKLFAKAKKRPSKFNAAIKAGMSAVKKSTSYGKKGTIKPAKKAFTLVTKLASAKKRKKKAPKSGIRRLVWNAMKGLR
jgi:hypothetical protein